MPSASSIARHVVSDTRGKKWLARSGSVISNSVYWYGLALMHGTIVFSTNAFCTYTRGTKH